MGKNKNRYQCIRKRKFHNILSLQKAREARLKKRNLAALGAASSFSTECMPEKSSSSSRAHDSHDCLQPEEPSVSGQSHISENSLKVAVTPDRPTEHSCTGGARAERAAVAPGVAPDPLASARRLDVYEEFALAIAGKIKTIKDLSGRVQLMNAIEDLVNKTCARYETTEATGASLVAGGPQAFGQLAVYGAGGMTVVPVGPQGAMVAESPLLHGMLQATSSALPGQAFTMFESTTNPKEDDAGQAVRGTQTTTSSTKKGKAKPTSRKRKRSEPRAEASTSSFAEVPIDSAVPMEFVTFNSKDALEADNEDEVKAQVDILEIKEERIQDNEYEEPPPSSAIAVASTSRIKTENEPTEDSVTRYVFVNDPLPIKLEVIDDTEED